MATKATRRFLWIFLPIAALLTAIGGYWIKGHLPIERDRSLAKDHPLQFGRVDSAAEAMVQLDSCLLHYSLVHDDTFPDDLEVVGPQGSRCTYAGLNDTATRLKYRFVYSPAAEDAKVTWIPPTSSRKYPRMQPRKGLSGLADCRKRMDTARRTWRNSSKKATSTTCVPARASQSSCAGLACDQLQ